MTDNFCFFTFSLFRGCSFSEFSNAVINSPFYGGLIHHKKALCESSGQVIDSNENKVRKELNLQEREKEANHVE